MALDYFAPGVYVEEVNRGSRPIEGVSMSVAGFIGFTEDVRSDAELFKPMMVTNWQQYLEYFAKPGSDGFTDFNAYLPFSVFGWFLNGGGRCWVTSLGTQLPGTEPPPAEEVGIKVFSTGKRPSLHFGVKETPTDGAGDGNGALALMDDNGRITVSVLESVPKPLSEDAPEDAEPPINTGEFFTVVVRQGNEILERFDHLTMNPEGAKNMVASGTTNRMVSSFKLTFDGEGLDDVDCVEFTPPEFAGTVVSLQRCTNGKTEAIAMQGGFTPVQEMTVKVVVNADSSSAYMLLHKWMEKCKPKARGGGGEMPKLSGSFTSFNWADEIVEEYNFSEVWPKKFDLDDMNSADEDDLLYATFTIVVEKYERPKV